MARISVPGFAVLLLGCAAVAGCGRVDETPEPVDAREQTRAAPAQPPVPPITTVGEGTVVRTSDRQDANDSSQLPWQRVEITNVFGFDRKPEVGEPVTVVPLGVDVAPVDVRIREVRERETCGDESLPRWWEVELEPVEQRAFFRAEALPGRAEAYPFDVGILYPAVAFARTLEKDQLIPDLLPEEVAIQTVHAAIDLNEDQSPDVLMVRYCCGDPTQYSDSCEYECGKTFQKTDGAWDLVGSSNPC